MTITNKEPAYSFNWLPVDFYKIEDNNTVPCVLTSTASYNVSKTILIPKQTAKSKYDYYLIDEVQLALLLLTADDLHKKTNKEILAYVKKALDKKYFICPATFLMSPEEYSEIIEEVTKAK